MKKSSWILVGATAACLCAQNAAFAQVLPTAAPSANAAAESDRPTEFLNAIGLEFRLVEPGSFMEGNDADVKELVAKYPGGQEDSLGTAVRRRVTISQEFYLAKKPVTVADFRRFVAATGYKTTAEQKGAARGLTATGAWADAPGVNWQEPGFTQTGKDPVVCVSFYDAAAYVNWLNSTATAEPELGGVPRYALPTEAQWEYAARAGTSSEYFWGDEFKDGEGKVNGADASGGPTGQKWTCAFPFNDGYSATSPTGTFEPNAWGFYDMLGNVWEWCADRFGVYGPQPVVDPEGAALGEYRVLRGGGWDAPPALARCAYRGANLPDACNTNYGFRVALVPPPRLVQQAPPVEAQEPLVQEKPVQEPLVQETPGAPEDPAVSGAQTSDEQAPQEPLANEIDSPGLPPETPPAQQSDDSLKSKIQNLGVDVMQGLKLVSDESVMRAVESIGVEDYRAASSALKSGQPIDDTLRKKIKMTALLASLGQASAGKEAPPNFELLPEVSKKRAILLGSLAFIGQELLDKEDPKTDAPKSDK